MTQSKPIWWDWLDKSTPGKMPPKLKPNAPDEMKKSFKVWLNTEAEYNKQWEEADKKRTGKPNKAVQEFINLLINQKTPSDS